MDGIGDFARRERSDRRRRPGDNLISRIALIVALPAALLLSGCRSEAKDAPKAVQPSPVAAPSVPRIIDSPSMQFLPRQEEVAGWRLQDEPLVVESRDLVSHLDKDARHFLSYEVLDVTVGNYQRTAGNGFAVVEIFRFPDFVKAFGAYSMRRKNVRGFVGLGNEAFLAAHSLHVWTGPFYIRILAGGDPAVLDPMYALATNVVARMPRAPGKPAVFGFLPAERRIPNSETFSSEPAFSQPPLANAFTARFSGDPSEIEGLILPAPGKEAAAKILNEYRAFFTINGKLLDPIPNLGEDNFTAEDRFFGRTVAFRIDRFVVAFRGYTEMRQILDLAIATDQRILGTIRKQLQSAEQQAQQAAQRGVTPEPPPPASTPPPQP